jgi:tetratricopeptide (TPR) repeat protein
MRRNVLALLILSLFAFSAVADDEHHHEDLSPEQLGTVHFPVSCSASVQKPFERGVALLHSFWYEEAEKQFQQISIDDPTCAMAHWGVAMSLWHQLWNHPNEKVIKRGAAEVKQAKSLHPRTDRERDYIAAANAFYSGKQKHDARAKAYSHVMEQMYQHYPDDKEAAAFYALSLLAAEPDDDKTFVERKKAAAVLEKLFTDEPTHPGVAHYLIHTYDRPEMAELGVPAARRYAKIAPAAPHALHMPSHIFARLGLWQDDIDSNVASIAASRKSEAMNMGDAGHQFHAIDFLFYAYMQSGHEADAQRLIDEVKAMPAMKDMYDEGTDPHILYSAILPASYALELHHWSEAAALPLVPGMEFGDDTITYRARAIGAARSGNLAQAHEALAKIQAIHREAIKKKVSFVKSIDEEERQAEAWVDHAEGKNDQAIKLLRDLAGDDEGIFEAGDGIPAREMLADMLLDMNQPQEALAEYQADLKKNPNRFDALYGAAHAAETAGKSSQASTYYAQLMKSCDGSNSDRPELEHARALLAQK